MTSGQLRIASWNVFGGRSNDGKSLSAQQIQCGIAELRAFDPDVLCLQEVWWGPQRGIPLGPAPSTATSQLKPGNLDVSRILAEECGLGHMERAAALDHTRAPSNQILRGTAGRSYGNVILSRRPIRRVRATRLVQGRLRTPQFMHGQLRLLGDEPRVLLSVEIDITPGRPISVACTHLSTKTTVALRQLSQAIRTLNTSNHPWVLAGDLNLRPALVGSVTAGMNKVRGKASTVRPAGRAPTYPAQQPRFQIDHILTSGADVDQVATVASPISDHRAITAMVTLRQ